MPNANKKGVNTKELVEHHEAVFFLGFNGGCGRSTFSDLTDCVLAFTPQVDISSYEAFTHEDFFCAARPGFHNALIAGVKNSKANIMIHYRRFCEEDVG